MKKALLTNPVFRYIFEVFVIVFSVTMSFYIQKVLLDKEKIELKNIGLMGVVDDLKRDQAIYNQAIGSLRYRINNLDSIFKTKHKINTSNINGVRGYFGFIPQNRNFNSMISTGAIEYIKSKELFNFIHTYYTTHSTLLFDMAGQDEKNYNQITDYINNNYFVKASRIYEYTNGKNTLFLKRDSIYIYEYESVDLRKMKKDEQLLSLLSSQKIGARLYLNASKKALAVNNKLKELIDSELEN
tara:strand:+ start:359 stop:1084 length:726 start_codon:yes stop_codon:yes gene_type:complete